MFAKYDRDKDNVLSQVEARVPFRYCGLVDMLSCGGIRLCQERDVNQHGQGLHHVTMLQGALALQSLEALLDKVWKCSVDVDEKGISFEKCGAKRCTRTVVKGLRRACWHPGCTC